ncbi:unnamed protein product, partial [Staurois parvus]
MKCCLSVHLSDVCQCPSIATYQCLLISAISAHYQCPSVHLSCPSHNL